jgi:hypothetical protein
MSVQPAERIPLPTANSYHEDPHRRNFLRRNGQPYSRPTSFEKAQSDLHIALRNVALCELGPGTVDEARRVIKDRLGVLEGCQTRPARLWKRTEPEVLVSVQETVANSRTSEDRLVSNELLLLNYRKLWILTGFHMLCRSWRTIW